MVQEGAYLCLVDFDSEWSDLDEWRERFAELGIDDRAFSAEQTAGGTTVIRIRAQHGLQWLRAMAEFDEGRPAVRH